MTPGDLAVVASVSVMTLASLVLMAYALWHNAEPRILLGLMAVVVLTLLAFAATACAVLC